MEKLNVGVVGLRFGRHVLENQLLAGDGLPFLKVVALCDLDTTLTNELAARHQLTAYGSLDALLADPRIEAIVLFTGPTGRAGLIRKIIHSGKHVMTTKPFERDPVAAMEVLQKARAMQRVVHLNSPAPLPHAYLRQMMAWRDEHDLGRPVGARSEVWCNYREKPDGSWYDDPKQCPVAPVLRLGIYGINDLVRLLGPPESVQVSHSRLFTERPTADNGHVAIRFRSGALASVFASFCINERPGYHVSFHVYYERGMVQYESQAGLRMTATSRSGQEIAATAAITSAAGYYGEYQWENFVRAASGQLLVGEVTPEEIVAGIGIINAMARGQESGRSEAIGHEEARA